MTATESATPCCRTREVLLEAGLHCFAEHGYEGTSLRMVADRANRNMSLIAHHFGNKEGLYVAVFRHMLNAHCPAYWGEPHVELEDLRQDPERARQLLRRVVSQVFKAMHTAFHSQDPAQKAFYRLWTASMREPVRELEPLMVERVRPLRLQVAACVQALRPDLSADEVPLWCTLVHGLWMSNTLGRAYNEKIHGSAAFPADVDEMAERLARLALSAIEQN